MSHAMPSMVAATFFTTLFALQLFNIVYGTSGSPSTSGGCNRYYFEDFSAYPYNRVPFFVCSRSDSSSGCAFKCSKKAEGCSSFVIDFTRKLCHIITSTSTASTFNPLFHSYVQCSTSNCPTCKGFIFVPNAAVQSLAGGTTVQQQLESGWCANVTKASKTKSSFSVSQSDSICTVASSNWTISPSSSQNAYYPCNTSQATLPPLPPPSPPPLTPLSPPPLPPPSPPLSPPPPPRSPNTSPSPPLAYTVSSFCTFRADGSFSDPLGVPECKYFYICGGGQVLLHDACPFPLIYGSNLAACDIPGIAICNSTLAAPPPPSLPSAINYTTGLDLNSTAATLRDGTQTHVNDESRYGTFDEDKLPSTVDWSSLFGNSVRQQQSCSGCWAYSTVDAIQSAQIIASGLKAGAYADGPLSVQQLITCSGSLSSCRGGWPEDALEYAATVGTLFTESTWANNTCSDVNLAGSLSLSPVLSWERIPSNNPIALKKAVANQPVIIGISTQGNLRLWNSSAIYTGSYLGKSCSLQKVDHNVLIVGYGNGYWLARNSWGSQWGDNGYFKIKMTSGKNAGVCNMLAVRPIYPVVTPANIGGNRRSTLQVSELPPSVAAPEIHRRQLVATCNGYNFQPSTSYAFNSTAFYTCNTSDSSTQCAATCIQNTPGCIHFVMDSSTKKCHAVMDFTPSYNATMHAYLVCLDSQCSYCQGYKFLPGIQLAPISGSPLTQPYDLTTCATSCQNSNCTAFSVGQTNSTCQQIYDQGTPTNTTTFNAYSVCPLGSEVSNSTGVSAGLDPYCPSNAALCGGGTCVPDPSASGGYTCQCPPGMVAVVDSTSLPVCVVANACTGSTFNPCGIGRCQNTGNGGYTCFCPSGFLPVVNALQSLSCMSKIQYALTDVGYYMDVPSNQDCNYVSTVTGLGVRTLAIMNNMTNCSQYGGSHVVVGPVADSGSGSCGLLYQLSSQSDTCASVKAMFGLSDIQFANLNPAICTSPSSCTCQLRSTVCVEGGQATAVGYPCSSYDTILGNDTCSLIMSRNNLDAYSFFLLNAGIDCDSLVVGDMVCNATYTPNYVTEYVSKRKLLGTCACKYGCFLVKKGNTCINLANTYYHCSVKLLQYWNGLATKGFVCVDRNLVPGRTALCYPQYPGSC